LAQAKNESRIGVVAADPLMTLRAYWDIGGTGAKADACAIWIVQFVGSRSACWTTTRPWGSRWRRMWAGCAVQGYEKAQCVLPHDGATHDKVYEVSYESALREAGFDVRTVPNMGAGCGHDTH
jgi:phage terminase large subunit